MNKRGSRENVQVSVLQMPIAIGDRTKNIETLRRMTAEAMARTPRPDVLLLPELWDIGFFPRPIDRYVDATEIAQGVLSTLAREYAVYMVGGSVAVATPVGVANRCHVYDRTGACIATYDKTHLFSPAREGKTFCAGDHRTLFSVDGVVCGVAICYDLRFPRLIQRMAEDGACVLFLPAQWPEVRKTHWRILTQARAIENQIFVAAANGNGAFANGMPLAGASVLLDPWGERLAEADAGEAILSAQFDLAVQEKIRATIHVFADQRKDLYD